MRGLRLDIDGRKGGSRYLVQVNDRAVYLPASQFIILTVLALERRRKGGDGWVLWHNLIYLTQVSQVKPQFHLQPAPLAGCIVPVCVGLDEMGKTKQYSNQFRNEIEPEFG